MAEYFFILGREPELSVAELEACFLPHSQVVTLNASAVTVRTTKSLPDTFIDRLGGTTKMGEVLDTIPHTGAIGLAVADWLTADRVGALLPDQARDVGASLYGGSKADRDRLRPLLLEVKKNLRRTGRTIRVVTSHEPQLSTVTVERQGLLRHGLEIVLIATPTAIVIGRTIAVQDYQGYSLRDYGRPAADAKRGMLPPKLAQIMLNLVRVQPDDALLDPFCGLGTVLQEAMLMGVRQVRGADTETAAVKAAQENIRWLLKEKPGLNAEAEIVRQDARLLDWRPDVIVTEPDLGRPLRGHEPLSFVEKEARRLEVLYLEVFTRWTHSLKPGGRVAMVWPAWPGRDVLVALNIDAQIEQLGWQRQALLTPDSAKLLQVADPRVLEYAREQARVRRQIRAWVKTR